MNSVTILVGTHDRYATAWPVFCHGVCRYWPDRPWPMKFITNRLRPPCGRGLKVGGDQQWTENTRRGLKKVETPVVLWLLEDVWLTGRVQTKALIEFAQHVLAGRTEYIRLVNSPSVKHAGPVPFDKRLYRMADDSPYRTAVCASFWKVETFLELLHGGETIWDFETAKGRAPGRIFCCVRALDSAYLPHVIPSENRRWSDGAIRKGKWTEAAREYARLEGLEVDFAKPLK